MSTHDVLENSAYLAFMLGLLGRILWQQKQAGGLVLALDRDWLLPLVSGFAIAMFVYSKIHYSAGKLDVVVIIGWGICWLIISLGSRTEMRENGLWHNCSLVRWSSIAGYRWEGKPPVTLVVNLRNGVSARKQKTFQISARYRECVERELKQRVVAQEAPR